MKCYLITNSKDIYLKRIVDFIQRPRRGRGRRQDAAGNVVLDQPVVIQSRQEFEDERFKSAFRNRSGADAVFIVPELYWNRSDRVDAGYRVAQELLETKRSNYYFSLVFISLFTRDQLRKMVGPEFSEIVNAFPHLTLDSLPRPETKLPVPAYSEIQFELIKRTVVSKSGRLDFLLHNLADLERGGLDSSRERANYVLDILDLPAYGGDDEGCQNELARLRESVGTMFTDEEVRSVGEDLKRYLNRMKTALSTPLERTDARHPYRVLIVEDDKVCRQRMKDLFSEYFTDVVAWEQDDILNAKAKIVESVKSGRPFQLIIMDLLFTESGKANDYLLPFNGLDLLAELRSAESEVISTAESVCHAVVRIVSAIPRGVISGLVKMNKGMESPSVFTKGGGPEQLQGALIDRMDEMVDECRYYRKDQNYLASFHAPRLGIFGQAGALEALLANMDRLNAAIEHAKEVIKKGKIDKKPALVSQRNMNPQSLLDHLDAIILHRQLVIKYLREGSSSRMQTQAFRSQQYVFDEEEYRAFVTPFGISLKHYDVSYLTTKLGFELSAPSEAGLGPSQYGIDLNKRRRFFDGELDYQSDSLIPNPETENWIAASAAYLEEYVSEDLTGRNVESFAKSGITSFLSGSRTAEDFLLMLREALAFVESMDEDEDRRLEVWSYFDEILEGTNGNGPDNNPFLREKIRNCSTEMLDLLSRIHEAFSM